MDYTMIKRDISPVLFTVLIIILTSCKGNFSPKNTSDTFVKSEIKKWKKELIFNGHIGMPCKEDNSDYEKWAKENSGLYYGFPLNIEYVKYHEVDINEDGRNDLFLYFSPVVCANTNGGISDYAKVVYSDGKDGFLCNQNIIRDIEKGITQEYITLMCKDSSLKNISSGFPMIIKIKGYDKGIIGNYTIWAKEDAHCCPSYEGIFNYSIKARNTKIQNKKITL